MGNASRQRDTLRHHGGRQEQAHVQGKEGWQEEGRRPFPQEGVVRCQGPFHVHRQAGWQDSCDPHPGYQDCLRWSQGPHLLSPSILDITEDDIRAKFCGGVANIAAVSLQIGYPTIASVPHSIANGFKNLMAVAAATDIEFKEVETLKAYLADPSAFAVAAPAAAEAKEEAAPAAAVEEEESSDDDMGFDMFG